MQVMDRRPQKTSITVSAHIKERVCSKKRGNQTYDDVLEQMLNITDIGERGDEGGIVFLSMVYVYDELKKLKWPTSLKITIQEDESLILTNDEFYFMINLRESRRWSGKGEVDFCR